MRCVISILLDAIGVVVVAVLCGCSHTPPTLAGVAHEALADCPEELSKQVQVAASAIAISPPEGVSSELVARRLLVSSSLIKAAPTVRVRGSTLTIITVGGTFAGSASVAGSALPPKDRALQVIPGRLRVEPFLTSPRLHSETIALDVTLVPGAAPADKMTVSLPPLWTPDRQPVAPDALQVNTSAQRHLTVFDVVEANVSLDVDGTGPGDARDPWRCSYETRLTLVSHDSVLPKLWDLSTVPYNGKPRRWLAFFEPSVGPVRAIFTDAQSAQAFATWLRVTGATRAGRYQLGLFTADADRSPATIPADRDIATNYQLAAADEVRGLTVGRVGEN